MQLFYLPNLEENSKKATFSKEESRHLFKVLRKKIDDTILISNGKNIFFNGRSVLFQKTTVKLIF